MLGRLIIMVLLVLALATPAAAASFDCNKAVTPFEKAICADPELSAKDEVLSIAFATAIGGLSKDAATAMRADEKAWLNYAERNCTDDTMALSKGRYDDEAIECFVANFNSRIEVLEASRMLKGKRFYISTRYATMPDPEAQDIPDYYWMVASKTLSLPRLDGDSTLAETFNGFVDDEAASFADLFPTAGRPDGDFDGEATSDESVTIKVKDVTSKRITLQRNDWYFGHGAAHGNYGISYSHFLIEEERPLEASDIFAGKAWKKSLLKKVDIELHAQLGEYLQLEDINDVADQVINPGRWDFTDAGLVVQFQPYEVASYADGAVTVTIDWDDISGDLTDEAMSIALSY